MKPNLLAIYLAIVLLPLLALAGLGAALARNEQAMVELRFQEILMGRLNEIARQIDQFVEARERELMAPVSGGELAPGELRRLSLSSPIARQYFLLDPAGDLVYPSPAEALTDSELAFLKRTQTIWERGEIPAGRIKSEQPISEGDSRNNSKQTNVSPGYGSSGWYVGYGERDLQLIAWIRNDDSFIFGSEANETRLKADIVALLPEMADTAAASTGAEFDGSIALLDSHGRPIYRWGAYAPAADEDPTARIPLQHPLAAWSLLYFAAPEAWPSGSGAGSAFYIGSGLAALVLVFTGLAVYFYREQTRAIREAQQRVSFVNQVSHELKIPLTNIRMYAEMLEDDLAEAGDPVRKRLGIIASESQRLSRLIGNVLTFNREKRGGFRLHPATGVPDDAVGGVLAHFESAFAARNLVLTLTPRAPASARFDRDALEQIVANLLSNVEKYVPKGSRVWVETAQDGDGFTVSVRDDGPGVAPAIRKRIFEPFYRPSNKLTDGVSGVGLGLTIARQLAQLHGGDLTLDETNSGAAFTVRLHAPQAPEEPAS